MARGVLADSRRSRSQGGQHTRARVPGSPGSPFTAEEQSGRLLPLWETNPAQRSRERRPPNVAVFVTHSSGEGDSFLRPSTELGPGIIPTPRASRGRNRTGLCQGAGVTAHGRLLPAGTWRSVTPSSSALPGHCHPASSKPLQGTSPKPQALRGQQSPTQMTSFSCPFQVLPLADLTSQTRQMYP